VDEIKEITVHDIRVFPLKRIPMEWGDVLHGYKRQDCGLAHFEELYFSWAKAGTVRDWKFHKKMTLNLIVPLGTIRFAFVDERAEPVPVPRIEEIGEERYARLTVPPKIWFSFKAVGPQDGLLANMADILHDSDEVERRPYESMPINWEVQ
jgi:dTDP-4-dehydrorhamnose 3,5-epimerase